jgi:hypothetical protein
VEPAELAQLIDFAERPHTENWSLRAALVRYTSPQPQRNDLLELVRRIQGGLDAQSTTLQRARSTSRTSLDPSFTRASLSTIVLVDAPCRHARFGS